MVDSNFESPDQSIKSLSSTASQHESSAAANSCGLTEVQTAKFFDAEQIVDSENLQKPYCNSREGDDSTTVLNETFLEAHLSALTSDEVDMQDLSPN